MPICCWLPSTGKSQVPLCAATFKFRCHFIFLFSWSLAFSRPKNGPDRITGSHSAAKRRFQRSARHATSEGGHEQASDTVSAFLARLEHTLAVHNPPPLAFHRSYYDLSPYLRSTCRGQQHPIQCRLSLCLSSSLGLRASQSQSQVTLGLRIVSSALGSV